MRSERGQTMTEYLGGLLVVSVIISAVATTDVGARIRDDTKRLVCKIAGGDCAATPSEPPSVPAPSDSDLQGPQLTDRPLVVLPFPGSVTVSCTYDRRDPSTCIPDGGPGVSVQASGEIKVERTPTTLDANGCPWQTLSLNTTLKATLSGEAERGRVGGTLQGYLGQSLNYGVTVTPGAADQIESGERLPPNPVDPRTIMAGESVLLTEEFFAGINARGSYRALQVEMGYDEGTRVSSGVKRISPTTVRVLVGDADFVRNALKLGVGYGDVSLSLGNTKDLADGRLHAVDIDISTKDGWDAYQAFLASGRLPEVGAPGTSNQTRAETLVYTDITQLEAKLGGIKLGGRVNDSEGRLTVTTNPDGTVDTVASARYGDVGIAVSRKEDANGNPVGTPTRSLLLHGVDDSMVDTLYQLTGQSPPQDLPGDLRLDFTETQLNQLRDIALDSLADRVALNGERPTREQIAESLADGDGVVEFDGVEYAFGGVETLLGQSQNADELLMALYHGGLSSGAVLDSLIQLLLDHPARMPIIQTPSC